MPRDLVPGRTGAELGALGRGHAAGESPGKRRRADEVAFQRKNVICAKLQL